MNLRESLTEAKSVRAKHAYLIGLLLLAYVAWREPLKVDVLMYLLARGYIGAMVGYWLDRTIFGYARPTADQPQPAWMLRRVAMICAGMIAMTMGA